MMHCVRTPDTYPKALPALTVGKLASGARRPPSFVDVGSINRQHPRFAADVGIKFYFGTQVAEGRMRNVSRGGLCADLAVALPTGTDVEVDITLVFDDKSVSEPLRLAARIVWCTPLQGAFQLGVSFRPLDKKRAEYLQMFLDYLVEDKPQRSKKATNIDDRFG